MSSAEVVVVSRSRHGMKCFHICFCCWGQWGGEGEKSLLKLKNENEAKDAVEQSFVCGKTAGDRADL